MSVSELMVRARPTAVIAETTSWSGPRWEIYGHFNTPGDEEVEIYYLVK